jgi:serpin B
MTAAGAVPDTAVSSAFSTVLRGDLTTGAVQLKQLATPTDANVTLSSANSLWARDGIKKAYAQVLADTFDAAAAPLTDAATVNDWVSEHTAGKIPSIVDDGIVKDPLVRALLVNAVYFKAPWSTPFKTERTERGSFKVHAAGPERPCAMMQLTLKRAFFARTAAGTAVALPYGDGQYQALLVLPATHDEASMSSLVSGAAHALSDLRSQLQETRVQLSLPRFTLSYGVSSLKAALIAMGLGPAFSAANGEFGLMSDDKDMHVSDVLHKAVLEVTEEGTTAAAATAVVMMTRAMVIEPRPEVVVFDRPFVMVIEHTATGAPLFIGRVSEPQFTNVPAAGAKHTGDAPAPSHQFGREFVPHTGGGQAPHT